MRLSRHFFLLQSEPVSLVWERLSLAGAVVEARLLPYWRETIVPEIMLGKTTLIAAHGNSLRALVKGLEGLSDNEVASLEIPTGEPRVYYFDDKMNVVDKKILLK